jgi:predicted O-methyltransferase YrrM
VRQRDLQARILALQAGDPFAHVIVAANEHRQQHGRVCGLYPAGPHVMRLAATLARASGARRVLDLGTGFGYSALWFAATAVSAQVEAVDQFEEHLSRGREFAQNAELPDRIQFVQADAAEYLSRTDGPYDLVHDDAWFGRQPAYFDRMVQLLKPGGVLTMPNWFLLQDALTGTRYKRWSAFAGPDWPATTLAYAEHLARDARLHVTWTQSPPLGIAVKC